MTGTSRRGATSALAQAKSFGSSIDPEVQDVVDLNVNVVAETALAGVVAVTDAAPADVVLDAASAPATPAA